MIKAVLFDLDGTLLDSAPDLVDALNVLRAEHELPALSVSAMQNHATAGALSLLAAGMPEADEKTVASWHARFLQHYQENIFVNSSLYEGAGPLLEFLEAEGIARGIVTNKPEYLTRPVLAAAGVSETMTALVCGDTLEEKKPHPAPVLLACRQLGLDPGEVMFVGDDPRDLQAGRGAGVFNCAAMYGYGSPAFLEPQHGHLYSPGLAIDSLTELIEWFRSVNGADR